MSKSEGHSHEHERRVWFNDCDGAFRLSVPGALRYFEEIAIEQCEALGIGFDYYREHDVNWLLSRWDLRFGDMPEYGETVTVRTRPSHSRKFLANREHRIVSADGTTCVEGHSQWVFLDTLRMRPKRVPAELLEVFGVSPSDEVPWAEEFGAPAREDHAIGLRARRGDTDINGHVNNVRYVEWARETLPEEWGSKRQVARLQARYMSETLPGAELRATAEVGPESTRHAISEGDRVAAVVELEWTTPASR